MAIKRKIILEADVKDAVKGVEKVDKGVRDIDKSSKDAKKGLGGMTAGAKGLGTAFKAIGIGLIIAAFMKLKELFSGNIETARKFEVMGAKVGAMFDVLRDRLEPLFMSLGKLFTDPLGSLKAFANAIKDNIINRVKGLIDTFGALGKVIKGVFTRDMDLLKEGASEAKTAFIQLNTGLDEIQQNKIVDTLKGITKEIKEETDAVGDLTRALQNVRDEERGMLLIRAKANKIIAESRLLAEDDTKSMVERLAALKAAVEEEKRVAEIELATQQKKVNALQAIIDLGKSSEEAMQELAAERAKVIELQTGSILRQKRVAAEVGTFTSQVAKEEEKLSKDKLDRIALITRAKELELEVTEELSNKEIALLIKQGEKQVEADEKAVEQLRVAGLSAEEAELEIAESKYLKLKETADKFGIDMTAVTEKYEKKQEDIKKKYAKAEVKFKELTEANKRSIVANAMGSVASLLGEETKAGKALAVGQAMINTYSAAAAALAPPPVGLGPIFGPIAAIGAVAAGLANVHKITSTKLPDVPSGGGGGGGGGGNPPSVPPIPSGGIGGDFIPNLEAIQAPELGGIQPVQAYVVENDISDAQALQEELEIQATL